MLIHNLGYPRIGENRELKNVTELYFKNLVNKNELFNVIYNIKCKNWELQDKLGIDLIPCNDFSLYDNILDQTILLNAIPNRYKLLYLELDYVDFYFSLTNGYQNNTYNIYPMSLKKWFNTNYHYIVPELEINQEFIVNKKNKLFSELNEMKKVVPIKKIKPVLIGPISYIMLSKRYNDTYDYFEYVLKKIIPCYIKIINYLIKIGIKWVQIDEPIFIKKFSNRFLYIIDKFCKYLYRKIYNNINVILTTYFGKISRKIFNILIYWKIYSLHIDLISYNYKINDIINILKNNDIFISLGVINGNNIWKFKKKYIINYILNNFNNTDINNLMISPNCSLIHIPINNEFEKYYINKYCSFAKQKLNELYILKSKINQLLYNSKLYIDKIYYIRNKNKYYKNNFFNLLKNINSFFKINNRIKVDLNLKIPILPFTTIGSLPQTRYIRKKRYEYNNNIISSNVYDSIIKDYIKYSVKLQEKIGVDVIVHGEFERNDMVEYFANNIKGFIITKNGWVQSYGTRYIKPPIIFSKISYFNDIIVKWSKFTKNQTNNIVKSIITGPITIVKWSFVNDNISLLNDVYNNLIYIFKKEINKLNNSNINIIQIDEAAIFENIPTDLKLINKYFKFVKYVFNRITYNLNFYIHSHICYSNILSYIKYIRDIDIDLLTIEFSRSKLDFNLIKSLNKVKYNIGIGVYDVHSRRIPTVNEIYKIIKKLLLFINIKKLWINPDCGLKTRSWKEIIKSLTNIIIAIKKIRKEIC